MKLNFGKCILTQSRDGRANQ